MRTAITFGLALLASQATHAQSFAAKGAQGTLTVTYQYSATGRNTDKYDPADWRVSRTMTLVVPMKAEPEQALSQMRTIEAGQMAGIEKKQAKVADIHKKMEPTMNDMMKIVERCGEDEACMEKAIVDYGTSADPTVAQSLKGDVDEVMKMDGPRYQLWSGLSQSGTYGIDEAYRAKTSDPLCSGKPNNQCSREETRKGGGKLPEFPEAKGISNARLEFDRAKKEILITLPVPFPALDYAQQVSTDFPDEKGGSSQGVLRTFPGQLPQITAAAAVDARNLSGTQTIKTAGAKGEAGTLTVKWQFVRQ
jgi:hypothetical protein